MRIFLADDEEKVCSALQMVFNQEPGMSVVGQASQVGTLLMKIQLTQPDVVLLDWELPGQPTADLLSAIHALTSRPKVIVLSSWLEVEPIALTAGADTFISKGDPPERLLSTLRAIATRPKQ